VERTRFAPFPFVAPQLPVRLKVVFQRALVGCLVTGVALAVGCSGDYSLERKGGPLPDTSFGGSEGTPGDGDAAGAIPGCVLDVIESKCQRCHGDPLQHGAPVAFFTADDFQAQYFASEFTWSEIAADRVADDSMPLLALNHGPDPIMPPVEPLTADEKTTLLAWLRAGALSEADASCP
jgi:hypothetical protein